LQSVENPTSVLKQEDTAVRPKKALVAHAVAVFVSELFVISYIFMSAALLQKPHSPQCATRAPLSEPAWELASSSDSKVVNSPL
jgi:hypothetical protein